MNKILEVLHQIDTVQYCRGDGSGRRPFYKERCGEEQLDYCPNHLKVWIATWNSGY
jgi:hypothetical protein